MSKKKNLIKETKDTSDLVDAAKLRKQVEFKKLFGKLHWEGDLEEMRRDSEQLQNWYDSQYRKSQP